MTVSIDVEKDVANHRVVLRVQKRGKPESYSRNPEGDVRAIGVYGSLQFPLVFSSRDQVADVISQAELVTPRWAFHRRCLALHGVACLPESAKCFHNGVPLHEQMPASTIHTGDTVFFVVQPGGPHHQAHRPGALHGARKIDFTVARQAPGSRRCGCHHAHARRPVCRAIPMAADCGTQVLPLRDHRHIQL